jgi:thiaminase
VTNAADVIRLAREDTAAVAQQLRAHLYIAAVEAGRLPREDLRRFAGEQWHIIASDLRSVASLLSRHGVGAARSFFLDVLAGERAAFEALDPLATGLGLDPGDLARHEPLAGAHAYTCYMAWLALYGSAADVATAYLVNFPAWGENCGRLSASLKSNYGLKPEQVAFFDLFASPAPGFEAAATAVIQADLAAGADPIAVRRAVRLLQAYELMYWDTLHQATFGRVEP